MNRRTFLASLGAPALLGSSRVLPAYSELLQELASCDPGPGDGAQDEAFWAKVQDAFAVDRSLINFNNGGVCPSPKIVQEALAEQLAFANGAPAHRMWEIQEQGRAAVREGLADLFGAAPTEIAITRNASEGLHACQLGIDLQPGDEVLCTDQDYGRMITAFEQRVRREGIRLVRFPIPTPLEDGQRLVERYAERITERTRILLACHVINLTGQVLPVDEICALGRKHSIPVIIDGAHGFGNLVFQQQDLECEMYATSLHKWLFAPFGCGMLYVAQERIPSIWPLMAAGESQSQDIKKFEEIGTHSLPLVLSIGNAVDFHRALGPERKFARLCYLRDRWLDRLRSSGRLRLFTHLEPERSCGIVNFALDGVDSGALHRYLLEKHKIHNVHIRHMGLVLDGAPRAEEDGPQIDGLRISPGPYARLGEIDRFSEILDEVLHDGVPG